MPGFDDGVPRRAAAFTAGAAGGFALGWLLSSRVDVRRPHVDVDAVRERLAGGARGLALRLRPARLRREAGEQAELTRLEDAVLERFLTDPTLSERRIDVGAISRGIVELSGSVRTADEAEHAVAEASAVPGVDTVVNRMEVEDGVRRGRGRFTEEEGRMSQEWTGRTVGTGSRRQGRDTDPDRRDDSRHQTARALEAADLRQFEDEGIPARPKLGARPEVAGRGTDIPEDQLDNQSPYGQHAVAANGRHLPDRDDRDDRDR